MKIGIVIDSTLDVSDEIRDKVNIVSLTVRIADKVFKDGDISLEEMFDMVRKTNSFPKTSQPSPGEFEEAYRNLLENHDYVISLHISSKLSGTYSSARLAAEKFKGRVFVFDTLSTSIIGDFYVRKILNMLDKHPEEIRKELERIRKGSTFFLTPGDLEFLKRGGRISKAKALLGAVLKLRPVIQVVDGELVAKKISRGKKGPLNYMKKVIEDYNAFFLIGGILEEKIPQELAEYAEKLGKKFRVVMVKSLSLAAHLGPGSFGVAPFEYA